MAHHASEGKSRPPRRKAAVLAADKNTLVVADRKKRELVEKIKYVEEKLRKDVRISVDVHYYRGAYEWLASKGRCRDRCSLCKDHGRFWSRHTPSYMVCPKGHFWLPCSPAICPEPARKLVSLREYIGEDELSLEYLTERVSSESVDLALRAAKARLRGAILFGRSFHCRALLEDLRGDPDKAKALRSKGGSFESEEEDCDEDHGSEEEHSLSDDEPPAKRLRK